jgi:hypothetical protein
MEIESEIELKSQFFFEETIDDKEYQINIFGQHE